MKWLHSSRRSVKEFEGAMIYLIQCGAAYQVRWDDSRKKNSNMATIMTDIFLFLIAHLLPYSLSLHLINQPAFYIPYSCQKSEGI